MARLVLMGPAREAAGTRDDIVEGDSLDIVLAEAVRRYGPAFQAVLEVSRVWVNGEPADAGTVIDHDDEVAVLPPVSGGCGEASPLSTSRPCATTSSTASRHSIAPRGDPGQLRIRH